MNSTLEDSRIDERTDSRPDYETDTRDEIKAAVERTNMSKLEYFCDTFGPRFR